MNSRNRKILVVMGVSGTGKSTIGSLLSKELSIPFFDGDDFHPLSNIEKMTNEIPLTDEDRMGWLLSLNELARKEQMKAGCVLACSALKTQYRRILSDGITDSTTWIYLKGTLDQISRRLNKRKNHFMSSRLLLSQFDALEEPVEALSIDIGLDPTEIIKIIRENVG